MIIYVWNSKNFHFRRCMAIHVRLLSRAPVSLKSVDSGRLESENSGCLALPSGRSQCSLPGDAVGCIRMFLETQQLFPCTTRSFYNVKVKRNFLREIFSVVVIGLQRFWSSNLKDVGKTVLRVVFWTKIFGLVSKKNKPSYKRHHS